jgi:hypothetical protein
MEVGANRDLAASMAAGEGGILPGKLREESDVVSPLLPCDGAGHASLANQGRGVKLYMGMNAGNSRATSPLAHSTPLARAMYSAGLT